MTDIHIETHQHEIISIGVTERGDVVVTFDNGPVDGEVIIPASVFQKMAKQFNEGETNG